MTEVEALKAIADAIDELAGNMALAVILIAMVLGIIAARCGGKFK